MSDDKVIFLILIPGEAVYGLAKTFCNVEALYTGTREVAYSVLVLSADDYSPGPDLILYASEKVAFRMIHIFDVNEASDVFVNCRLKLIRFDGVSDSLSSS